MATLASSAAAAEGSPGRLDAIDLVRGVVMVLMLLDHTREFTHKDAFLYDPLDATRTTPLLYFTRWITHLCAPTFVFLAGLGAGLQRLRGKTAGDLEHFLWTRGLWLVVLELTVVRTVMWFNWNLSLLAMLQVIWAIGVSMVILSAFVRLPLPAVGALGWIVVLGHNLLDRFQVQPWTGPDSPLPGPLAQLWMVVHQGGVFPIHGFPSPLVLAMYPFLPWTGVLFAGYGAAALYAGPGELRRRRLLAIGAGMLLLFFALRVPNLYGNPKPWVAGPDATQTLMHFFDVEKYPPSAAFVLVTLGLAVTALGLLEGRALRGGVARAFVTFGRVPLFFYVLQWITAHLAGMMITALLGKGLGPYFLNMVQLFSLPKPPDIGGPLWATYACWLAGSVALYFPCRWFAALKARRADAWLRYL
jgi:uncharacterized membrane protein